MNGRRSWGRRIVLVLVGVWSGACLVVAVWVAVGAHRQEAAVLAASASGRQFFSWTDDMFGLAIVTRGLLLLGLMVVAVAWLAAFGGRRAPRRSTAAVVACFLVAAAAVLSSNRPVSEEWFQPPSGAQLHSEAELWNWLTYDRQAIAALYVIAALCGSALWTIAFRRPDRAGPAAPPGWYPDGRGELRYWDGADWTEHSASWTPDASSEQTLT